MDSAKSNLFLPSLFEWHLGTISEKLFQLHVCSAKFSLH